MLLPVPGERFQFKSVTALLLVYSFMVRVIVRQICALLRDGQRNVIQ